MPACDGNSCTAAFNSACCSPFSAGGTSRLLKRQRPRTAFRECLGPLANGVGIPFQRPGHRRGRPTLRQQPQRVPPFPLPWRRSPIHPPSYLSLIHSPPLQQWPHLHHAQQQPPTLICSSTNSTTVNSTQRQCGFHLGFSLGRSRLSNPSTRNLEEFHWSGRISCLECAHQHDCPPDYCQVVTF